MYSSAARLLEARAVSQDLASQTAAIEVFLRKNMV
jgi:hypothetical protein